MVSSSLDKSLKRALAKETSVPSDSGGTNTDIGVAKNSGVNFNRDPLPPNEKILSLFPKCKPRSDYQTSTTTPQVTPTSTDFATNLISTASSSSQSIQLINTQANSASNFNMNNSKLMKLQSSISPDHKKQQSHLSQFSEQNKNFKTGAKHDINDDYVETNPFRISSNNRYFYTPNNSLFNNDNSAVAGSNNNKIHHYHYPHRNYQMMCSDEQKYYFEPDEIEHNPYMVEKMASTVNTIPSSILKATPPATPPALTTTPVDSSPLGSNRNMWDLSPIKTTTPTRIKTQSPTTVSFSKSQKGSYKKLLASPVPIEEDLETGHFYYNSKKPYYQAPQTDSDSNEPVLCSDVHETERMKLKSLYLKSKIKHSESNDYIYDLKKKEDTKMVKSKSGSGIMEYEGSPRRFGMLSNDDSENSSQYNFKANTISQSSAFQNNCPPSSPPRPGFPVRIPISSYDQRSGGKSPNSIHKLFSFECQKNFAPYPNSSTLIPSTFIQGGAYDTAQENSQVIFEESDSKHENESIEDALKDSINENLERIKTQNDSSSADHLSIFQVTSPTEENIPTSTFDYLYEFSETRKVLEEFFKCPETDKIKELEKFNDLNESDDSLDIQYDYRGQIEKEIEHLYIKQSSPDKKEDIDDDNRDDKEDEEEEEAYLKTKQNGLKANDSNERTKPFDFFLEAASRSSLGDENEDVENVHSQRNNIMNRSLDNNSYTRRHSKNFNYSPDTTDYDSNYGDFDFESESPLRFLASDYINLPSFTTSATATVPSATVDLSGGPINNYARYCTSMPVLEDGLSSGHASDNENNNPLPSSVDINILNKRNNIASSISTIQKQYQMQSQASNMLIDNNNSFYKNINVSSTATNANSLNNNEDNGLKMRSSQSPPNYNSFYGVKPEPKDSIFSAQSILANKIFKNRDPELESLYTINTMQLTPPPPAPVPHRQSISESQVGSNLERETDIHTTIKDIRTSIKSNKTPNADDSLAPGFTHNNNILGANISNYYDRSSLILEKDESPAMSLSPVWIPRSRENKLHSPIADEKGVLLPRHKISDDEEEEEIDTDLETDRLLGHQIQDDGFYNDKTWGESKPTRSLLTSNLPLKISPKVSHHSQPSKSSSSATLRHGLNTLIPTTGSADCCNNNSSPSTLTSNSTVIHQARSLKTSPALNSMNLINATNEIRSDIKDEAIGMNKNETSIEADENLHENINLSESLEICHLESELVDSPSSSDKSKKDDLVTGDKKKKNKNKEVLIEGVLFRARYLGSTQLVCEGQPTKSTRMMQAEEAVSRIKALAPDGENQPSTEVDLFISTEKIMVLNTDLKEIMMDHALRTISYIADIGDLVVLMARRRFVPQDVEANSDSGTGTGGSGNVSGGSGGPTPPTSGKINRTPKMICHVFESEEAQFIAQSIGQAFQVAYMEFLKANGIEDHSFMKEMDYQEVLNSQEIFGDELEIFAKKELQKEVVVPKAKGEILGVVIVESGWGSMLPTVVIANLASNGAAARCGQLNIGDQIIAINGLSLVGLPLSQCQSYIKNTKNQTVVKFTVVPCAPVVEVKIKRPNTKYQLGFSVQNGVICSLLRGGIAERGGVRVGHRIIEINNQSVVAVPHEKIVNLLATSVGEILMKTMPTSMFRLLTGQENPIYI